MEVEEEIDVESLWRTNYYPKNTDTAQKRWLFFLFKFIITVPKQKSVTKVIYTYR